MITKLDKAEITPESVSIQVRHYEVFTRGGEDFELQVDEHGAPASQGHRRAIAYGDHAADPAHPSQQEKRDYEASVREALGDLLPVGNQHSIIQRLREERDALAAEVERLQNGDPQG